MGFTCQILFENNSTDVFYSGETINGVVKICVDSPTTIKKVLLKIDGVAFCKWIDTGNNSNYVGEETYIKLSNKLVDKSTALPVGTTSFKFLISLPENCPSSIEEDKGSIKYSVTLVVKQQKGPDLQYKKPFKIIKEINLNQKFPDLKHPCQIEKHKQFRGWCCVTGNLYLKVILPLRGFVSEQKVLVQLNVINHTKYEVSCLEIRFVKRTQYHSSSLGSKTKEKTSALLREIISDVSRGQEEFSKELRIPKVVPSLLKTCSILEVSYEIQVEVKLSKLFAGVILKIPIVLGTIPYASTNSRHRRTSNRSIDRGFSNTVETPPPSYETAMSPPIFPTR